MDILRKFLYWVSGLFYKLIPDVYGVLYDLAGARLFQDDTVKNFSTNLYLLVSVVMLFVFGVQLIKAIVNPDLLTDNKKGTAAFIKRAILSVVIITVVPIVFNTMYTIQDKVLENSLIEKIVTGFDGEKNELDVGQFLSASILSELVKPEEDENAKFENATALSTYYNGMLNDSVDKYYDLVGDSITEKYEDTNGIEHYSMHYEALAMLVAGIIVCYILVTACMDMALRLVKLSILQLIAPVSIIAYLVKGDESLNKWLQEVGKTYAIVFLKLATISMVVFGFQKMQDMFEDTTKYSHPWIMRLLIMIGLLTLINELPNLIQSLFGVSFQFKGGIAGRLGNMFGPAGNIAKNAWGKVTSGLGNVAKKVGTVGAIGAAAAVSPLGFGLGAAGFGAAAAFKHRWNKGTDTKQALKDTKGGRILRTAGRGLSAFGKDKGGIISGVSAGLKEGTKAKEELFGTAKKTAQDRARINSILSGISAANGFDGNGALKDFGKYDANKNLIGVSDKYNEKQIIDSKTGQLRDRTDKEKKIVLKDRLDRAVEQETEIMKNVRNKEINGGLSKKIQDGMVEHMKANSVKSKVDAVNDMFSKIYSGLDSLEASYNQQGTPESIAAANMIKELNSKMHKGAISSVDLSQELAKVVSSVGGIGKESANLILKDVDKKDALLNENETMFKNQFGVADTGAINFTDMSKIVARSDNMANDAKDTYTKIYDAATEQEKIYMSKFIGDSEKSQQIIVDETKKQSFNELDDAGKAINSSSIFSALVDGKEIPKPANQSTPTSSEYGPEYYPNSYDDFDNYNSQPRIPRPESTGTGSPQPEPTPTPISSSTSSQPTSQGSTPERVIEREVVRETNNQNNGPTTLDNVTINASDINAQNLAAQNVNAQGFNANNAAVDNGHLDQLGLNHEDAIAERQSDKIVEAIEELNDTIEESNKNNNE